MKSLLTAATLAVGIGLALPAFAQPAKDAGQTSPLAQVDPGKTSPLAQKDPNQTSPLAQRDPAQSSPLAQAQDCSAMWKRADVNSDGMLSEKEVDKLRSVLNAVDSNKDGKISQAEFTTACQKGELKSISF